MDIATGPDLIEETSQKLRILSVETRLRMLALLAERNLCVGALACQLGVSQGAVSQHLKILRDAGLVTAERDGYFVHYRVDREALALWQRELGGMLDRLQEEPKPVVVAAEATTTQCKMQKEGACARRKSKPVVGRATT